MHERNDLAARLEHDECVGRVRLHVWLWQYVRDRSVVGRTADRAQLAAEGELRALCRAALRLAVHSAAIHERALLALSHPSRCAAYVAFRAHRSKSDPHRAAARER